MEFKLERTSEYLCRYDTEDNARRKILGVKRNEIESRYKTGATKDKYGYYELRITIYNLQDILDLMNIVGHACIIHQNYVIEIYDDYRE